MSKGCVNFIVTSIIVLSIIIALWDAAPGIIKIIIIAAGILALLKKL